MSASVRIRTGLTLENSRVTQNVSCLLFWDKRRSSCWRHGEGLYEDDKVSPWTGAGRLPQFRTLASQFLLGQAFTSDPRSWRISSRTLKNVRAPRFWMVWEKL